MKLNKSIQTELAFVAGGLLVGSGLICLVFALIGHFDYTVVLGALWGSLFAWLSIYLLARRVQKVADSETEDEQKLAQKHMRSSYYGRMLLMVFAIVIGIIAPFFHYIAALIPFLLPKPILTLRRRVVRSKDQKAAQKEEKSE